MTMKPYLNQGVWFYPGKIPAKVVGLYPSAAVDLLIDEDGEISKRTNVVYIKVDFPHPAGEFAQEAALDDLVDLDRIKADLSPSVEGSPTITHDDDT